MSTKSSPPYDFTAIVNECLRRHEDTVSDRDLGVRLGISERRVRALKENPDLDVWEADRLCCKGLKLPTVVVFPDFYADADLDDLEAEAAASEDAAASG